MFSNITTTYNQTDASLEIIILLAITFILGIILGASLRQFNKKKTFHVNKNKGNNKDDLKIIDGIGIKTEKLLNKNKIYTFDDLIESDKKELKNLLKKESKKYKKYNHKTWHDQAQLASNSKWGELKEYQNILKNK